MTLRDDWNAAFSQDEIKAISFKCPHCELPSTFSVLQQHREAFSGDTFRYHLILLCNYFPCRKVIHIITTKKFKRPQDRQGDDLEIYPSRPPLSPHKAIPPPIGEDWVEAQKVYEIGATKAAALLCRRILYGVLLNEKCKEHPLHEGIKELDKKHRLPSLVVKWLTEIKEEGHDAAHPHRALSVPAENVDEIMKYTGELLRIVYIEPFELEARLTRKAGQQQTP